MGFVAAQRNVGIREVAAHAGVSDSTVSNVTNRPEVVAAPTLERVHASMAELGYVVNAVARQLRLGGASTLGMIVTNIADAVFAELAHDCEVEAENAAMTILLSSSDGSTEREERYLRMFDEQRIGGLLIDPVGAPTPAMASLADRGMPVVLLGTAGDLDRFCSVVVDDVLGGSLAVEHLVAGGRRRIVFVGPASAAELWHGARNAADGHPGVELSWLEVAGQGFDDGVAAAGGMLGDLPDAVSAATDALAVGLLQHLVGNGVRVPEQLAIVGYGDGDAARQATVPLTTIRRPRRELAAEAIRLMHDQLSRPTAHAHESMTIAPELVVRASTS